MEKIIFATSNSGKMREIREIMQDLGVEILSMKEAGIEADIVEDGKTFEENALIKARTIRDLTGCPVLAWTTPVWKWMPWIRHGNLLGEIYG